MYAKSRKEKEIAGKKSKKALKLKSTGNQSKWDTSEVVSKENGEDEPEMTIDNLESWIQDDQKKTSDGEVGERNEQRDIVVVGAEKFNDGTPRGKALQYLNTWKYDRDNWKFSKKLQCWLVTNMLNVSMVPHESFQILKNHMALSQGGIRQKMLKMCQDTLLLYKSRKDSSSSLQLDMSANRRAQDIIKLFKKQ